MRGTQHRSAEDATDGTAAPAGAFRVRVLAMGAIVAMITAGLLLPARPGLAVADGPGASGLIVAADTSGSATTSQTAETSSSVPATGESVPESASVPATATKSVVATTATFAKIAGTNVRVHYPAPPKKLIAVGFHQAENKKAVRFRPHASLKCIGRKSPRTTKALLKKYRSLKLFQQPLRGRGTNNFTAADCSVPRGTTVLAPVTGVVTNVRSYKLYGRISDRRLEIMPDGGSKVRVVMIHIKSVKVKKGARVVGGKTPVAAVRNLKLNSTIDRFVPAKRVDHVHLQVNKATFKGSY